MIVKVYESKEAIGTAAASLFAACVIMKPRAVLGLATGSTPILTYQRMIELYRAGAVDFSGVTTFNLDEYVGLSREHEQSYYAFMMESAFPAYQRIPFSYPCPFRQNGGPCGGMPRL